MSIIATAVKHLIAAGVSGDDLVRAIAEMEAEMEPRDTRSAAAKRQQRYRERLAERNEASQSVTSDACVTRAPPPDKSPPDPQKLTPHPRTGETRARIREAARLPDDWQPAAFGNGTVSGEIIAHRGKEWARRVFESFRNHWHAANGPNARKRDWQAAWANWVIEQDRRDGNRNGSTSGSAGGSVSGYGRTIDATLDFIADCERGHPG